MLCFNVHKKGKHVFLVHRQLLTKRLNKKRVIILRTILCQHFCKPHFHRIKFRFFYKLFMIQFIVVKRLNKRTHLVELPRLVLKRDSVNIVGETDIV